MLNKSLADAHGWEIFLTDLKFGSYVKSKGSLICDLRKIPKLTFGIKQIYDLVVATPKYDKDKYGVDIEVSNLLGRSFIGCFKYAVDQEAGRIYFKERNIIIDPNYSFSRIAHSHPMSAQATTS